MKPDSAQASTSSAGDCAAGDRHPASWLDRLPGPRWPWLTGLLVVVVGWGVADVRLRGLPWPDRPLEHKTDFTVYTEAGAAFFDGRPPYEVANPRGWKYCYPPLFAMLVAPLYVLPMADQVLVWYFLSVLFCWGCIRESGRIVAVLRRADGAVASRCAAWLPRLGAAAFLAALFPTFNCLQRGQVGVLKLYLLLLGFRIVFQGRTWRGWLLGGIVLAGPIALKLTPALPVAFLLMMQLAALAAGRWKDRAAWPAPAARLAASGAGVLLGLALFLLLVPALLVGWNENVRHLKTFSDLVLFSVRSLDQAAERAPAAEEPRDTMINAFGGNQRTVRNQNLANGMFRLATWAHYTFAGGPDDRVLDSDHPPRMPLDTPAFDRATSLARLAVLVLLLAAGLRLGLAGDALGQAAGFGMACVGMLVIAPVAWAHYFMLLAPGVLFVPLWLDRQGMTRAAAVMAVLPAALSVAHYALNHQPGRLGVLGLGTAAWLVAACVLALVAAGRPPRTASAGTADGVSTALSVGVPGIRRAAVPAPKHRLHDQEPVR